MLNQSNPGNPVRAAEIKNIAFILSRGIVDVESVKPRL